MTLYKYCSGSTGAVVLESGTFRWSSPLVFNDIFDVERIYDVALDWDELRSDAIREYLRVFTDNLPLIDNAEAKTIEHYRTLYRDYPQTFLAEMLARKVDSNINGERRKLLLQQMRWSFALNNTRIFCAAAKPDNILMWAHYADSFRGLVIEFNVDRFLGPDRIGWGEFHTVRYVEDGPRKTTKEQLIKMWTCQAKYDQEHTLLDRVLCKSSVWAYEEEWRTNRAAPEHESVTAKTTDFAFDRECISTVYLGPSMSTEHKGEILGILRRIYPWCRISNAMPTGRGYKLEFRDRTETSS